MKVSVVFFILIVCSILSTTSFAKVRRNAGPSHFGGMGLDMSWYCKYKHGRDYKATHENYNAYGWRCTNKHTAFIVSMNDACKAHYGNTASARVGPQERHIDWHCDLGLNLTWFCKKKYGSNARAIRLFDDPFSWKCKRGGDYFTINMNNACRKHYTSRASAVLGEFDNPEAFTCQIR